METIRADERTIDIMRALDTVRARGEFVSKYCADKGWDRDDLSFDQIMEIRAQAEWKNAGRTNPNGE